MTPRLRKRPTPSPVIRHADSVPNRRSPGPPKSASIPAIAPKRLVHLSAKDWHKFRAICYPILVEEFRAATRRFRTKPSPVAIERAADKYLTFIRPVARKWLALGRAGGQPSDPLIFLSECLELFPAGFARPRRGRRAKADKDEVQRAVYIYQEIMLALQVGRDLRRRGVPVVPIDQHSGEGARRCVTLSARCSRLAFVRQHAPILLDNANLTGLLAKPESEFAARLATHGTRIHWKTLIHRHVPTARRAVSISNDYGVWTRSGKRTRSWRWAPDPKTGKRGSTRLTEVLAPPKTPPSPDEFR
jgi:hypothetical protein